MTVIYRPPAANPAAGGLYTAATILDGETRLQFGVTVDSINCGTAWIWPIACDAETPDPSPKGTDRPTIPDAVDGDVIGSDDDCAAAVPEAEAMQRAEQTLRLQEPVKVETQIVDRLLSAAGTPDTATGLAAAVGALEETVAPAGVPGVFHAAVHLLAPLMNAQLVIRQGGQLLTPNGHRWAFGAGYAALEETIVATGPVTVHRGPIVATHGPDYPHNDRLSVAEREVVVTWECWADAITIESEA